MKTSRYLLILMVFVLYSSFLAAQSDYRTRYTNGSWNTATNWQRYNGSSWVTAATPPTAANANTITIRAGSNYSLNTSLSADQLVIENGGQLNINSKQTLTVVNASGVGIINGGALVLNAGSTLINNGTIANNLNLLINGTLNNNGTINEGGSTCVGYSTTGILNNKLGSTFNIISTSATTGGQLNVGYNANGTFNNYGTLVNNCPSSTFPGIYAIYGVLKNYGVFANNSGAYINIYNYGTITNYGGYTITNNGNIICNGGGYFYANSWDGYGLILNGGALINNANITINETGVVCLYTLGSSLLNNGTITNYGGSYYSPNIGGLNSFYGGIYQYTNSSIFTNYGSVINKDPAGYYDYDFGGVYFRGILSLTNFNNYGSVSNNNDNGNHLAVISMNSSTFNNYALGVINNSGNICIGATVAGNPSAQIANNFGTYNENWATIVDDGSTLTNVGSANFYIGINGCLRLSLASGSGTKGINNGNIENLGTGTIPWAGITTDASTAFTNNNIVTDKGTISNNGSFTNNNLFDYYMTTGSISGTNDFVYGASGILKYHGSIAQTTSHWEFPAAGVPFVTIDNSHANGVTLDASHSTTNLNLINGPLNLNQKTFTISNADIAGITRTSGYILSNVLDIGFNSKVQWNIEKATGVHVFPFGVNSSTYIPFSFDLKNGENIGNVSVSTYPDLGSAANVYTNRPTIVTNLDGEAGTGNPGNAENIVKRFWRIEPTGSGTVDVTYSYAETEIPVTGEEVNSMVAQRFNTTTNKWEAALPGQLSNTTTNTVTVLGVTNFSPWAISRKHNPLPIELLYFNGKCEDEVSILNWATASETNNDYFTVQQSEYGIEWKEIGAVAGAGNSNTLIKYTFSDSEPNKENTFYRLQQTDFDGTQTTFSPILINCKNPEENALNFINVSSNENGNLNVAFTYPQNDGKCVLMIYDNTGRILFQKGIEAAEGTNSAGFDLSAFPSGIYLISICDSKNTITKRIVL